EDSFPAGSMRLHISVKEEGTGQEATIERNITVDRSSQAQIPVEVRLAGESYQTVPGVAVMGSTRLYLWRQRNASGVSDDNGIALLNVEVLSEKPTHYIFRAVPSIVDGLLYEAADSVELELAPGATTSEPIIVTVTRSTGQIQGVLSSGENIIPDDLAVIAIQLPFGASFRSELTSDKVFKFEDIPIDRYLIAFDNEALGDADLRVNPQGVDLVNGTGLSVSAPVQAIEGAKLRGQITDENNFPLPFAWISVEGMNSTAAAYPGTDGYSLAGLPDETITMVAHAPGHYSQAMVVHPDSVSPTNLSFTLKPDEDTEAISWEDGVLTLPSESDIELSGDQVLFRRGWIWGNSGGAANGDASVNDILPKHIRVAGKDIELGKADFSIEFLPGEQAWLFVSEGEVKLRPIGGEETIIVSAGSMANLLHGGQVQSVPMDPVVIAALHSDATAQINPNWEPTLKAQIRDRLARLGVGSAQVVTFVTYFFVLLGVLVIPLSAVYLWWGRRS
ncbi:MAG TPA: hypothetical protein VMY18_05640, partial [Acidobacteriota bacterium]|nr:hypothetical protein [Acidobacteriota bacterium]